VGCNTFPPGKAISNAHLLRRKFRKGTLLPNKYRSRYAGAAFQPHTRPLAINFKHDLLPPLQFATENSRTLRKDLRNLRLFQPPDIVSLEAVVQNFRL